MTDWIEFNTLPENAITLSLRDWNNNWKFHRNTFAKLYKSFLKPGSNVSISDIEQYIRAFHQAAKNLELRRLQTLMDSETRLDKLVSLILSPLNSPEVIENAVAELKKNKKRMDKNKTNVFEALHNPETGRLDNRVINRFGSNPSAVPVVFDHAVGKAASSFPSIYLQGKFPTKFTEDHIYDEEHSLLTNPPFRTGINALKSFLLQSLEDVKLLPEEKSLFFHEKTSLSPERVKQYRQRVRSRGSREEIALAELILSKTLLISPEEFDDALERSWFEFVTNVTEQKIKGPFYLFVAPKVGSDQWIMAKLKKQLQSFPFIGLWIAGKTVPKEIERDQPINIVMLDDALYTGIQKSMWIEEELIRLFGPIGHEKEEEEEFVSRQKQKINFHLVIPFATKLSIESLKTMKPYYTNVDIYLYAVARLEPIEDLIKCEEKALSSVNTWEDSKRVGSQFSIKRCPTVCSEDEQVKHFPPCETRLFNRQASLYERLF